ncbi:MAG: hypothetical protein QXX55_00980 [Candidatus Pacearchaeota archaeon]
MKNLVNLIAALGLLTSPVKAQDVVANEKKGFSFMFGLDLDGLVLGGGYENKKETYELLISQKSYILKKLKLPFGDALRKNTLLSKLYTSESTEKIEISPRGYYNTHYNIIGVPVSLGIGGGVKFQFLNGSVQLVDSTYTSYLKKLNFFTFVSLSNEFHLGEKTSVKFEGDLDLNDPAGIQFNLMFKTNL